MNRRKFLALLGVTGASSLLAGCPGAERTPSTPRATSTRRPPASPTSRPALTGDPRQYGSVVDLVEAGVDPEGGHSIVPLLEEHADDDTLLVFPPGRYLMDDTVDIAEFTNLGIVGDDATIVPTDGFTAVLFHLGRPDLATDLLVEGLEFDIRAEGTGPRPLSIQAGGRVTVRDVSVTGLQDDGWGMMRIDVTDVEGSGLVDRLRLPDGSTMDTNSTGCFIGEDHRGEITFRNCRIEGFADNGLYAEPSQGSVRVIGGYYANCNVASVRVGGNSLVRDVHVRCDREPPDFGNMRGIRLREGRNVLVENCLVEMIDVVGSDGGIVLAPWLESATVRDTTVRIDTDDVAGILVKDPRQSHGAPPSDEAMSGTIRLEDITVSGSAAGGAAIRIVARDGCVLEGIDIQQGGANRQGIRFENSDAVLRDTVIDVTGESVVSDESTVEQIDVRTNAYRPPPGWFDGPEPPE